MKKHIKLILAVLLLLILGAYFCISRCSKDDTPTYTQSFRPSSLHFAPQHGWMNDPNGMVYKDGEYHLFFQHHPKEIVWAEMHWGHAVSKDLVSWEELPIALFPDENGMIFSGSCVIDHNNTAGFGKDAMVAIYTACKITHKGDIQAQAIAYSTDNGRTFTKYNDGLPVLTDSCPDFRDPKVFWYEKEKKWVMSLAVQQEVRFYSSKDLKKWTFTGKFGKGYGNHHGVWECPDLFFLDDKWVLIVNINPGGIWGGSATQYFVGEFDGKTFTCDTPIGTTQWMDYGKDHYATVTWNEVPDGRRIGITWLNNWEYATRVPATEFRSTMSVPVELSLQQHGDGYRLVSQPAREVDSLRQEVAAVSEVCNGSYEIDVTVQPKDGKSSFTLFNNKGEKVVFTYNFTTREFSMDRRKSGLTKFAESFYAITSASIDDSTAPQQLRIIVDRQSVEIFDQSGQFSMTNMVFPEEPYTDLKADGEGIEYKVYKLK